MKKTAVIVVLALLLTGCTATAEPATEPTSLPTVAPTQAATTAPTQAPTEAPTEAPTDAPTEPAVPQLFHGWDILSPDMVYVRNESGLPVFDGAYYNHWVNGYLIGKSGVDFLSFHTGEPVWIKGKQEQITINHAGKQHVIDFVWCSHMGEIGVNYASRTIQNMSSDGVYVSPIYGNDKFVQITVPAPDVPYWYLLNLETMELSDPISKLDPIYQKGKNHFGPSISPNADKAIIVIDNGRGVWNFADGKVTNAAEYTDMDNANQAYWASGSHLVIVSTRYEEPQLKYADAVLYNMEDGTARELYKNARFGWFSDVGGLEHKGRMYVYYDTESKDTVFVDVLTGTKGTVDHGHPWARLMGINGIEYFDKGICYLLKPDGTATPLFTTDS